MELKILEYDEFIENIETIKKLMKVSFMASFDVSDEFGNQRINREVKEIKEYLKDGSAILIGVFIQKTLVGFAWTYKHEYLEETRLHVNEIVVEKEFRGRGVGKKLLTKIIEVAAELKVEAVDLSVTEKNSTAMNLYEDFGFFTERRYLKKEL